MTKFTFQLKLLQEVRSWQGKNCTLHYDLNGLKSYSHIIFPEGDWLKVTDPIFQSLDKIHTQPHTTYSPGI
jgi:hypothetical protein